MAVMGAIVGAYALVVVVCGIYACQTKYIHRKAKLARHLAIDTGQRYA
jgi:hypothetical protein